MKDKSFKVQYMRTDSGCLQVFIHKGKRNIANLTIFPSDKIWLDVPDTNSAPVDVFPDNALHRVWSQEICGVCGWKSEPFEGIPVGLGGTLDCPECRKAKRHPTLEGCFGSVESIRLDYRTKQPMMEVEE